MRLKRLYIRSLRCLSEVDLQLNPRLNLFVGDNGAGKTSVLEAAFLLSHGRSFRGGQRDALTQRGGTRLDLFAEVESSSRQRVAKLGLGREAGRWQARIDGADSGLGELVLGCPVVCFSPGSHALVSGAAEERRRYLDWGLFHVEQSFIDDWRRYQRALKQRNALLRSSQRDDDRLYDPWENELAYRGERIDTVRGQYMDALLPSLEAVTAALLPELGQVRLHYQRGWPEDMSLGEQLAQARERDRLRGHTRHGIHRADFSIQFEHAAGKDYFSRGQEKLVALCLYLTQCLQFKQVRQEWPIFCLDDLASELDNRHQQALWSLLSSHDQQILVTGTILPTGFDLATATVFHVEHGAVKPAGDTE